MSLLAPPVPVQSPAPATPEVRPDTGTTPGRLPIPKAPARRKRHSENQYGNRSREVLRHRPILDAFLVYVPLNRSAKARTCPRLRLRTRLGR